MKIEKAIENLKKKYEKGTKTVDGRLKGGFVLEDNEVNTSINIAIQALEKQKNNGWIPVSKGLPKKQVRF